jgi:bidirectional [NiFe] hydrogenase diaphorase subunit
MIDTLEKITEQELSESSAFDHTVRVCISRSCLSSQSEKLKADLELAVEAHDLHHTCKVKGVGCMGLCSQGPLVSVESSGQDPVLYGNLTTHDVPEIVEGVGKTPVQRLTIPTNIPFFQYQKKIVLENCGRIDPGRIEEYIAAGGYGGLLSSITEMSPAEVIDQVVRSGLRGRGGAGYSAGLKWTTVAKAGNGVQKYVVCNADEGDPGAFKDRSVLEADPHRVLEGMAIAGYAVGATEGYIYVRGEYPLAVGRLNIAIQQARERGILGTHILGTPFSFNIHIRVGAGAYVCGEETALIASIEGKRGQPRPRPPYPAELGLWGKPTLINNVETLSTIPAIIRNGGDWYASIGMENSKGTKVFALAGSVRNQGLIEVPMGITLREIVYEIGGGVTHGKCKAVQTGGPSGGCVPYEHLDVPVDYEAMRALGSIIGSGGMIILDESSCMVEVAKYFLEFCKLESCGKCIPCRVGTTHLYNYLDRITRGEATLDDLAMIEELSDVVKNTSLCGLGQNAANPIYSTLQYFREEYLAHIERKECPAGSCTIGNAIGKTIVHREEVMA